MARWQTWFAALALAGGLAMIAPPATAVGYYGKTDVFASAAAFAHTNTDGARFDDRLEGFRLLDDPAGGFRRDGSFTSEALRYNSGFNRAVPSWNADCPTGTWVRIELQANVDGGEAWTPWYEIATWGDPILVNKQPRDAKIKKDAAARVNEDTLELEKPATRLRYRVTLHTERPEVTPVVTLVSMAVADSNRPLEPDDTRGPAWGRELAVPFRSQTVENGDLSWRVCGPTSTSMALETYGVSLPTADVARASWDDLNNIYGNWPFLAAAASRLMRENADSLPGIPGRTKRYQAFVLWSPDWKDAEREILNGNPCVISIRTGPGELRGAPYNATAGHLILLRGFTKDGNPICNDPAARTEAKGRVVYDRRELLSARRGNPIIVFRPYG